MHTLRLVSSVFALTATSVLALAACSVATPGDDPMVDSSESALRALKAEEVVGDLAFGETKTVQYSETPRYRALRVQASAGDTIDAWVRGTRGADAQAWILGSSYATLATNRDASTSTTDAHVVKKVGTTGTYYLVVREANLEDAELTVALAPRAAPSSPSADPFDPASCGGPSMTRAEAVALLAPGTSDAIVGRYVIQKRSRTCSPVTGCGAWGASTTMLGSSLGSRSLNMEMRGDLHLKVVGSNVQLELGQGGRGSTSGSTCSSVGAAQACSAYAYIAGYQWGGSGGMYPTQSVIIKADNARLTLGGVLTSTCVRLADTARSADKEEEYVLLAKLTSGTTPPTPACPDNKHLMQCGSRASSGQTTCCQMGLTTCPQSGCDCWGACN